MDAARPPTMEPRRPHAPPTDQLEQHIPMNQREALTRALVLSITATTDDQSTRAAAIAEEIRGRSDRARRAAMQTRRGLTHREHRYAAAEANAQEAETLEKHAEAAVVENSVASTVENRRNRPARTAPRAISGQHERGVRPAPAPDRKDQCSGFHSPLDSSNTKHAAPPPARLRSAASKRARSVKRRKKSTKRCKTSKR